MRFDVTAPLTDLLGGITALEASAGTGKTWTITAITTRLIAEADVPISELLVITFTRNAAAELRSRIRQGLTDLSEDLNSLLTGTRTLAEVDDLTHFHATAVPRTAAGNEPLLPQVQLAEKIARLTRAVANLDAATITTIDSFCSLALAQLGMSVDASGAPITADPDELQRDVLDDCYLQLFGQDGADEGEPLLSYKDAGDLAKAVMTNPTAALHPGQRPTEDEDTARRWDFAHLVRNEYTRRLRRAGVRTYADAPMELAKILDPPEGPSAATDHARGRLQERWTHVLVDEFQDTDDTQWRILGRAFPRNLLLIGDPKQAIYAFRGGDVTTYQAAVTEVDKAFTLEVNFRSDDRLLTAFNGLFAHMEFGPGIHAGALAAGKTRRDVRFADGDDRAPLRVYTLPEISRLWKADEAREAVERDVVADIGELLAAGHEIRADNGGGKGEWRAVEAGDVAVLCLSNAEVIRIQQALVAAGIPAVVSRSTSVFTSEAAHDWLVLLTAIENSRDSARVKAAALTPFFAYTGEELLWSPDDVVEEVSAALAEYNRLLTDHGAAPVFHAALGWQDGRMPTTLLGQEGGKRRLTDLRHLSEVMQSEHPRTGARALGEWLRSQRHNPSAEEHQRRLESDASAVQVQTIHSAKGLQFPFVYVPSTAANTSVRTDRHDVFHNGRSRAFSVAKSLPDDLKGLVRAEMLAERSRVLYVALTRAIGQVTVYWARVQALSNSPLHRMMDGAGMLDGANRPIPPASGWAQHVAVAEVGERTPPPVDLPRAPVAGQVSTWTRRIDHSWRRSSYTSLAAGADGFNSAGRASEPALAHKETAEELRPPVHPVALAPETSAADLPSPMSGLPRGARFGTLVHAVLEHLDPGAPDLEAEITRHVAQHLLHWPLPLAVPDLVAAIRAVLTTPLSANAGTSLVDLDPGQIARELDFEIPLDGGHWAAGEDRVTLREFAPLLRAHLDPGDPLRAYADHLDAAAFEAQTLRGYLTGSIDLVFAREGKYYVADYKTNWLGPTEELNTTAHYHYPCLVEAMAGSSYPLQALLYTVALHRYLTWRLPGYDPATHVGGVVYLYVRGMAGPATPAPGGQPAGVFSWAPPPALITKLSDLLDGKGPHRG